MERPDRPEQSLREEIARLGQELEQAHVALEDAHAEIAALTGEQDRLHREAASDARTHAAEMAALIADALRHKDMTGELRAALDEASVLAEELQASNEELHLANERLDQRVTERTAELELVNADLHRRVEAETAARVQAQAELFQMQKLEAIGQLTGGIAHDFNNLLMVIINGLQVLAQSDNPRQRERALNRTQEASWRASELTRRLLVFARRQALHPVRVDLPQHVDGLRSLLGQGLRDNIQLHIDMVEDLWPLEADLGALELALLNIVVNARDAMPDGGRLTIAARNSAIKGAATAARHAVAAGDYVEVAIEDTGVGMAAEVLEKVFEPFFTTKSAGSGTGLGLAQVYGFTQQSGGTAWVESRVGEGTLVRLLLPRSLREIEPEPLPPSAVANRAPCRDLHVMVVEDEPAVAAAVIDMLMHLGHHGTSVTNVAAALAILAGGGIDLVLSDVLLPGGNSGLDLAREMRNRHVGIPVILTSGYSGAMTQRLSTMDLPFLPKPYKIETLQQTIDSAMQQLSAVAGRG